MQLQVFSQVLTMEYKSYIVGLLSSLSNIPSICYLNETNFDIHSRSISLETVLIGYESLSVNHLSSLISLGLLEYYFLPLESNKKGLLCCFRFDPLRCNKQVFKTIFKAYSNKLENTDFFDFIVDKFLFIHKFQKY